MLKKRNKGGNMAEKKLSQRCRERFIRESKALQKNLEKRKQQLAARKKIKQEQESTSNKED